MEAPITADLDKEQSEQIVNDKGNIALLVIYFVIRMSFLLPLKGQPSTLNILDSIVDLGMYTVVFLLIIKNRKNLGFFHIDKLFIVLFFAYGIIFRIKVYDSNIVIFIEWLFRFIAMIFGIVFWKMRPKPLPSPQVKRWNLIAIISGIGFAFFAMSLYAVIEPIQSREISFGILFSSFIVELIFGSGGIGGIGTLEEPIFRGFLWGVLKQKGWPEGRILFIQAFLFWICHIDYWNSIVGFWIVLPFLSILLGFLAWKSRSLFPPIITHGIFNAILKSAALRFR